MGTCVNISQDGWSISINDIAYIRSIKSKELTNPSQWPQKLARQPAPPNIYRKNKSMFL